MKRPVVLVLFAVIPLVAGCERQASQDTKFLISPGGGIGSVRIGMPMSDAMSVLGAPKSTRGGTGGETFYAWFDAADSTAHGLYVVALADHVIRAGVHYDPEYVTPVGLRTGVNQGQVESAMGEPTRVVSYGPQAHGLVYNNLGIGFTIIDGPRVRGYRTVAEIDVFGPQQWKWGRTSPSMKGNEQGRIAPGADPLGVGLRVFVVSIGPVLQLHEVTGVRPDKRRDALS